MKKYKWILIAGNLLLLLVYFNWSVFKKEQTLSKGELVLFRLAPVDPRSLMQGDYMALNYEVANVSELYPRDSLEFVPSQGYAVIASDSNQVAHIVRLQSTTGGLKPGEKLIKYHKEYYDLLKLGAESFFFEEGQGKVYEKAEYGGLRIDDEGNSILVGLYDEHFRLIKNQPQPTSSLY